MENDLEPTDLLNSLDRDRAQLADRLRAPWWLSVGFGLVAALFVMDPLIPGSRIALAAPMVVVCLVLLALYRRDSGVRLALLPPAGNPTYWLTALAMLFLLSGSYSLASLDLHGWIVVPAVLAFGVVAWATVSITAAARERMSRG